MMSANIVTAIYIAASVLFILSPEACPTRKARSVPCGTGSSAVALAVGATIFGPQVECNMLILMIVIGSVIGLKVARRSK